MRFHHSTRRGRTRHSARFNSSATSAQASSQQQQAHSAISRWAQLSYCRQTNIHFGRRLVVEPPAQIAGDVAGAHVKLSEVPDSAGNVSGCGGSDEEDDAAGRATCTQTAANDDNNNNDSIQSRVAHETCPDESETNNQFQASPSRKMQALRVSGQVVAPAATAKSALPPPPAATNSKLDMESARAKLIAQVEKHPFWSNKAAKRMRLLEVVERRVFVYELASYCERRELEWRYEPFRGFATRSGAGGPTRLADQLAMSNLDQTSSFSQPTTPTSCWPARSLQVPPPSHLAAPLPADQLDQINKSPIRRSCSSAASSPMHRTGPTSGAVSNLRSASNQLDHHQRLAAKTRAAPRQLLLEQATQSSRPPRQTTSATANLQSVGERPMPSAELVWSIEPPPRVKQTLFTCYAHSTELPGSSFVKRCHGCQGRGRLKCTSCHGVGYEVCISCSGKGTLRSAARWAPGSGGRSSSSATADADCAADSCRYGSMWDNAASSAGGGGGSDSPVSSARGRAGGGCGDEPGGITQSGASTSAWSSESCHFCHGAGQKRCWICAGRAYNSCLACAGTGWLRCYLSINISWTNHCDECVLNNSDSIIPRDRLRLSGGLLLLDETGFRLRPLSAATAAPPAELPPHLRPAEGAAAAAARPSAQAARAGAHLLMQLVRPEEAAQLRAASAKLLERHLRQYKNERLLRQRQKVTQIECSVVNWEWKRRRGHFVVYGDEQKVYIAKYPFKSICNIT